MQRLSLFKAFATKSITGMRRNPRQEAGWEATHGAANTGTLPKGQPHARARPRPQPPPAAPCEGRSQRHPSRHPAERSATPADKRSARRIRAPPNPRPRRPPAQILEEGLVQGRGGRSAVPQRQAKENEKQRGEGGGGAGHREGASRAGPKRLPRDVKERQPPAARHVITARPPLGHVTAVMCRHGDHVTYSFSLSPSLPPPPPQTVGEGGVSLLLRPAAPGTCLTVVGEGGLAACGAVCPPVWAGGGARHQAALSAKRAGCSAWLSGTGGAWER